MISQRRSRPPQRPNLRRTGADTLDDLKTGEVLELGQFAEFRSLIGLHAQVDDEH
jgi:hypothetical protein